VPAAKCKILNKNKPACQRRQAGLFLFEVLSLARQLYLLTHVQGMTQEGFGCFSYGFGKGRMAMNRSS